MDGIDYEWENGESAEEEPDIGELWLRLNRVLAKMQKSRDDLFDDSCESVCDICGSMDMVAMLFRRVSPGYDPKPVYDLTERVVTSLEDLEHAADDLAEQVQSLLETL